MLRRWIPSRETPARAKPQNLPAAPEANPASPAPVAIDRDAIDKIRAIPGRNGESLFERVVMQFSKTAPPLAASIRAQCDARDAEALWRSAHSLKSSAATLGATAVSLRCAEIEALARDRGAIPGPEAIDALDLDLATAQACLRELVRGGNV
jgi:HPt (histidine-containing phosphotransfer) domain-containing protein